jgi:hypothetical protein
LTTHLIAEGYLHWADNILKLTDRGKKLVGGGD